MSTLNLTTNNGKSPIDFGLDSSSVEAELFFFPLIFFKRDIPKYFAQNTL